jgi:hypothetical protein
VIRILNGADKVAVARPSGLSPRSFSTYP